MTVALPLVASLALALSPSNVGVVVTGGGAGVLEVLDACPVAVEVTRSPVNTTGFLRGYQAQCAGTGILQLPLLAFTPSLPSATPFDLGVADARTYFGAPTGSALPATGIQVSDVQWVTGPSNLFQLVDPNASQESADWLAGFVGELAQLVKLDAAARGGFYHLLLPHWSNPNPGAFCAVFQAAFGNDGNVGWTWRATVTDLTPPASGSLREILGHESVHAACPGTFLGVPLFVEVARAGGWSLGAGTTPDQLVAWLRALDGAADGDAEVRQGAILLRSLGGGGIDDLAPAAAALAAYLTDPAAPPPDGNGTGNGGTAPPTAPGTGGGTLGPGGGGNRGCGQPAGALALVGLAPLLLRRRRAA